METLIFKPKSLLFGGNDIKKKDSIVGNYVNKTRVWETSSSKPSFPRVTTFSG